MRLEDVKCGQIVRINHSLYGLVLGICLYEIADSYTTFISKGQSQDISVLIYQLCRFDSNFGNDEIAKEFVLKIYKEAIQTSLKEIYISADYVDTIKDTGIQAKTEEARNWLLKNKLQGINLEHNIIDPELFVKEIGKIESQIDSFVKKAKKCFEENINKVNPVKEFKLGEVYLVQKKHYKSPVIAIYMKENVFSYYKTRTFSKKMFVFDDEDADFNFDEPPKIKKVSDLGFNVYDLDFNRIRMNKYFAIHIL